MTTSSKIKQKHKLRVKLWLKQILRAIGRIKARYIAPIILVWLVFGPGMYALAFHEQVNNPRWIDEARSYLAGKGHSIASLMEMTIDELMAVEVEVLEVVPYYADYEAIPITYFHNQYRGTWWRYSCYVLLIFLAVRVIASNDVKRLDNR